jgi:hypothetical protein
MNLFKLPMILEMLTETFYAVTSLYIDLHFKRIGNNKLIILLKFMEIGFTNKIGPYRGVPEVRPCPKVNTYLVYVRNEYFLTSK